jgi:RecG-like helicase
MAGTRQSGLPEFRIANLMEDTAMLALAQREARKFVHSEEQVQELLKEMSRRSSSISASGLVTVG